MTPKWWLLMLIIVVPISLLVLMITLLLYTAAAAKPIPSQVLVMCGTMYNCFDPFADEFFKH